MFEDEIEDDYFMRHSVLPHDEQLNAERFSKLNPL